MTTKDTSRRIWYRLTGYLSPWLVETYYRSERYESGEFKVDKKEFVRALYKIVLQQITGLPSAVYDLIRSFSFQRHEGPVLRDLIISSLSQALDSLDVAQSVTNAGGENWRMARCNEVIEDWKRNWKHSSELSPSFFDRPTDLDLLETIKSPFRAWLERNGVVAIRAGEAVDQLKDRFVESLAEEWKENQAKYGALQAYSGQLTQVFQSHKAWRRYRDYLIAMADKDLPGEEFSLRKVYVPLRAYYEKQQDRIDSRQRVPKRVVVNLHEYLECWIRSESPEQPIVVLAGEPGSGKSSCAKILTADWNRNNDVRILFIPMHLLVLSETLEVSLTNFTNNQELLRDVPFSAWKSERYILIVCDGLDELADQQGRFDPELPSLFWRQLERFREFNMKDETSKYRFLITGRQYVLQKSLWGRGDPPQVLNLLPYWVVKDVYSDWQDPDELLSSDQREEWWRKYGVACGKNYNAVPALVRRNDLDELTIQPLLNYLIARMYARSPGLLATGISRNEIYEMLIDDVHDRVHWAGMDHVVLTPDSGVRVNPDQFKRFLEELGVAAWHGTGRSATLSQIIDHFGNDERLRDEITKLWNELSRGVHSLLIAFFFRLRSPSGQEEHRIEFTHKTFGEYLTARRIVRAWKECYAQSVRQTEHTGLTLAPWIRLCGPGQLDESLLRFIRDEVRVLCEKEVAVKEGTSDQHMASLRLAQRWQEALCTIIGSALEQELPFHLLDEPLSFRNQLRFSRSLPGIFLALLDACAAISGKPSVINWALGGRTALGDWLNGLRGQRRLGGECAALKCLRFLSAPEVILRCQDLAGASLHRSVLVRADLSGADLSEADLSEADLREADLSRSNLRGADLRKANMHKAILRQVDLSHADLTGAQLTDADLSFGLLHEANLRDTSMCCSLLNGADLTHAILEGANLSQAALRGTNLSGVDLRGVLHLVQGQLAEAYGDETTVLCSDSPIQRPGHFSTR